MTYHPLLEDLAKWENEEHFYAVRYNWWSQWPRFDNAPITPALLEKDEFKIPTDMVDFKTGEKIYEISTFSFTQNLGLGIEREIEKLKIELQEKFLILEKESQKMSIINLINEQMEEILEQVRKLDLEERYKEVIVREFKKCNDSVQLLQPDKTRTKEQDWAFKYTHLTKDGGKGNLHNLMEDLISFNWIDGTDANKENFKRFFSGKKPKDKIIWTGKKAYLRTFLYHLFQRKLVEATNKWFAVESCFIIFFEGKEFPTKNIRSIRKSEAKNILSRSKVLVDILEE